MKRTCFVWIVCSMWVVGLIGCADKAEKQPVGPVSETSRIPWNSPVPGQGQGQFGMMQQNQYRR